MKRKIFSIKENEVTDEKIFLNRREIILGITALAAGMTTNHSFAETKNYYNKVVDREITDYKLSTKYNNFFEFGTSKEIWKTAQKLKLDDWKINIDGGKYNKSFFYFDDLIKKFHLEERIYKFRCVEAWGMVIPWYGFQLSELITLLEPESSDEYVAFETFFKPEQARNQKQSWYPWPYTEIITIKEAMNPLSFIAVGIYGKKLPKQNGAPLRLVLPWKYGFKSIKSIVRVKFLKKRVKSFWEKIEPDEYGFWANVNPKFPHRRWSQEFEKDIGTGKRYPTKIFNGYGEWVEALYPNANNKKLFF